jgi:hypothetical protein
MVDPKTLWNNLLKGETAVIKKLGGFPVTQPAPQELANGTAAPTAQQLQTAGWQTQYQGGTVGITYDFGFAGAGDDLTQPFGFLRSATTGKYYYRPVRGQMTPASMAINNKKYTTDFHQHPFDVLLPRLMTSLAGASVGRSLWNSVLNYTQLDPAKIFVIKTALLCTTALNNSFSLTPSAQTKIDTSGEKYSKTSFVKYTSTSQGAKYPGISNLHTELAKLIHRLKITPDIARSVAANGGQTLPSKWDQAKIVYMGDINPGAWLLSVLPADVKQALNAAFKVDVNFYEYQAAIDKITHIKLSDIQVLYDHVRELGDSASDLDEARKTLPVGAYIDAYMLKLGAVQKLVTGIDWQVGSQDFTDVMRLFFLMRRLLAEIYTDIEFIVSTYGDAGAQVDSGLVSSSASGADVGYQDSSVDLHASMVAGGSGRTINYDLLMNKVLASRVKALKDYATFVMQYIGSFKAKGIGANLIGRRYTNLATDKSTGNTYVDVGGPDSLSTYFPPDAMKQTMNEFASAIESDAKKIVANIDGEIAVLSGLAAKAQAADVAYMEGVARMGVATPGLVDAKVAAEDDLVTALRAKASWAQGYGLYPLGYEEKLLKIIELPGAVYLAYCLNYLMSLLSKPFEGDALYYYDDSFYDEDSSYLNLLAVLMRAHSDLSKAAAIVSNIAGPVQFANEKGEKITVPSGSQYYLDNLKKYDQYYLLQEQNVRQALAQHGAASAQYKAAVTACSNASTLLMQKKRSMNALLRTFEFDRRQGVRQNIVPPLGTATDAQLGVVAPLANAAAGAKALVASSALTPSGVSVSASALPVGLDGGVAGTLEDGTPVYTYERSVNGFLQAELAHFAFRARMLSLDSLKEFVFSITGIQAEDLWTGVEAKKRQMLKDQQAALAMAVQVSPLDLEDAALGSLDQALASIGGGAAVESTSSAGGAVAEDIVVVPVAEAPAPSLLGMLTEGVSLAGPASVSVAPLVLTPVPDVMPAASSDSTTPVVASSVASPSIVADAAPVAGVSASVVAAAPALALAPVVVAAPSSPVSSSPAQLLEVADLDAVVSVALARGQTSYNDASSQQALSASLASVASAFSVAGVNNDSNAFSVALKRLLTLVAGALNPSPVVGALFVGGLNQAMSVLAFNVGASGVSDLNSFDNMLEVVTYLQNGMLAGQASTLQIMVDELSAYLQSH